MHKNNLHNNLYDLNALCTTYPLLKEYVFINKYKIQTLDFSNPKAVKILNTALLQHHYAIQYWNFPNENLCPPIPSRADYIHYLSDLISSKNKKITVLDIGTGATCIYPLLGQALFKWEFIGTDIDNNSIKNATQIVAKNQLQKEIKFRLQPNKNNILNGVVQANDFFDVSMCNPPFYKTELEAVQANTKKNKNLKLSSTSRNFSGNANELWYKGGEKAFLHNYIYESSLYKKQFHWFTSLVSKKELLKDLKRSLKKLGATTIKVVEMNQGSKISRFIAWKY